MQQYLRMLGSLGLAFGALALVRLMHLEYAAPLSSVAAATLTPAPIGISRRDGGTDTAIPAIRSTDGGAPYPTLRDQIRPTDSN